MRRACVLLLALGILSGSAQACSWAVGNFYQVTALRGRVVGKDLGLLGFRWLRQSFSAKGATLTLYEYRHPAKIADLKVVAEIKADSHGNFDFGSIPKGHYTLDIYTNTSDRMGGSFDVEVTDAVRTTRNITLDVSPAKPDCSGGHEFIEDKA